MLKKTTFILSGLLACLSTHGQGYVTFSMQALGTSANGGQGIRVYDVDGVTRLAGTGFLAQLWAAPGAGRAESDLVAVGKPVFMRSNLNPIGAGWNQTSGAGPDGLFVNTLVYAFQAGDPGSTQGGPATLQMRVWQNMDQASYNTIVTSGLGKHGKSVIFSLSSTGYPPETPRNLVGLQSFTMSLGANGVPEPSTFALGMLAGAALLWRRRK